MSNHDHRHDNHEAGSPSRASAPRAPGKRTLTGALPASRRALRDQPRPLADMFAGSDADIADTRPTISMAIDHGPDLSDRQVAVAQRRNPRWIARLQLSAQSLSTAAVDSAAFAFDVAALQSKLGIRVDGIAGPKTAAAVGAVATNQHATPPANPLPPADDGIADTRSTIDAAPFAADDPFGMHLLDDGLRVGVPGAPPSRDGDVRW